jgi:hypothetical protein
MIVSFRFTLAIPWRKYHKFLLFLCNLCVEKHIRVHKPIPHAHTVFHQRNKFLQTAFWYYLIIWLSQWPRVHGDHLEDMERAPCWVDLLHGAYCDFQHFVGCLVTTSIIFHRYTGIGPPFFDNFIFSFELF